MNGLQSSVLDADYQKGKNKVFFIYFLTSKVSGFKNYGYTCMAKKHTTFHEKCLKWISIKV